MEKIYNKLVRDKIPEIIAADNATAKTRILGQAELVKELFKKLQEEAGECERAQGDKEELAKEIGDVYEVLDAIIRECGLDPEKIKAVQTERRTKRGGFDKKVFLESTEKN